MENGQEFVDYYKLLQVNPNCDARILEISYHYFAKMYHPDHAATADVDKFNAVVEAYRVLRDEEQRAEYDKIYAENSGSDSAEYPFSNELDIDNETAVSDAEIHDKILLHLYKRRRESANDPGIVGWLLQEALECTDEQFEFHVWYLKSKGFLEPLPDGTLAVTIEGVDQVIANGRSSKAAQLLLDRARDDAAE